MCSINGFNFTDRELILKMNRVTRHRGPDATGVWEGRGMTLGHNRLSIIDLSERAAQPMRDERGRFTVTFNGEIYNFKELRRALEQKYRFRSASDTEVILYLYKEYGPECVKQLNGIFAFALWDTEKEELFLARDHSGVKPLYYFWDGKRCIFSSEIKAILLHRVPREVDRDAFNLYMRMLYVPEPHTMFHGIKKLPPAHYALLKGNHLAIRKYWEVSDFSDISSRDEAVLRIRALFRDSVRGQLISDRPVGVFLSGGMDSSAVLGAVSEIASRPVKTYSVGFEVDVEREKFNADFLLARETARHYRADHHELVISAKDIADTLSQIAWHLDEPNANPTAGAIYLLSRLAKGEVAVVQGGDGADELFGGYRRYAISRLVRELGALRQPLALFALAFGRSETAEKLRSDSLGLFLSFLSQKERAVASVLNPAINEGHISRAHFQRYIRGADGKWDPEKQFMNIDRQSWLTDESLLRTDKMTMAWGLEERVPILDYRLTELAYRIPTAWKIRGGGLRQKSFQGKSVWKEAVAPYLPEHLLHEQKRGFFTPMAKWLRTDLKEMAGEVLSPAHLNADFFNAEGVQKMWREHLASRAYNLNLIWAILMWQLWYDTFMKKHGTDSEQNAPARLERPSRSGGELTRKL